MLTDSYSDFMEVGELKDMTTVYIIKFFKEQFSCYSRPDVLVKHVKSNSKAKAAAEIVKKVFKKAYRDNKDPWLALIDQRNVPKQGVNSSLEQRLMA